MKLLLERITSSSEATIGTLFVDGVFACFVLEDEFRQVLVKGETRILAGKYALGLHRRSRFLPRYKKEYGDRHDGMLHVLGVPGRAWILFHWGNTDSDTDGCLLVGETVTQSPPSAKGEIGRSRAAYKRVILPVIEHLASGGKATLEIIDRDRKAAA